MLVMTSPGPLLLLTTLCAGNGGAEYAKVDLALAVVAFAPFSSFFKNPVFFGFGIDRPPKSAGSESDGDRPDGAGPLQLFLSRFGPLPDPDPDPDPDAYPDPAADIEDGSGLWLKVGALNPPLPSTTLIALNFRRAKLPAEVALNPPALIPLIRLILVSPVEEVLLVTTD